MNTAPNTVEFIQELEAPAGYGYVYRKVVTLVEGEPEMVIAQSLEEHRRQGDPQ